MYIGRVSTAATTACPVSLIAHHTYITGFHHMKYRPTLMQTFTRRGNEHLARYYHRSPVGESIRV